jgi:membrane associated rhomboid family serine protease
VIIPILHGLVSWRRAPVTWALVGLNFMVLAITTVIGGEAQQGLEKVMRGDYFTGAQGRVYAQYVNEHPDGYPVFVRRLARQVADGQSHRVHMLGQLAFRDSEFLEAAARMRFDGDQVAFKLWKKKLADVEALQETHPSFALGLNSEDSGFERWVTYIFVHSGIVHLLGNMLFLVIFGSALEIMTGGLGVLFVFLLSGVFAAGVFALMTGVTSSPLVGASGAVSGVMALYSALNWGRPVRYFYWLFLPFRGFMGFVYMPAWVGLILWGINDLAGYLGTLPELGGVAYTAHLGGEMAGVLVALLLFGLRRIWPVANKATSLPPQTPMWSLIPFLPPVSKT